MKGRLLLSVREQGQGAHRIGVQVGEMYGPVNAQLSDALRLRRRRAGWQGGRLVDKGSQPTAGYATCGCLDACMGGLGLPPWHHAATGK